MPEQQFAVIQPSTFGMVIKSQNCQNARAHSSADAAQLIVNLKTAKVLGVSIPNGILLASDEVIE
jgi:hypothetical protein